MFNQYNTHSQMKLDLKPRTIKIDSLNYYMASASDDRIFMSGE